MNKQMVTAGMALCLLIGAQQAVASVPLSINYSGELVETTTGTDREMTDKNGFFYVRLYASPTSTQPLWARQYTVIMNKGKFNIEISEAGGSAISGALTSSLQEALRLQAADPQSDALYIGVRPLEDLPAVEITPRQRVVSVPFAMLANDAVAARRNFTVTNGQVRVKNLTVLKQAIFSNSLTIAASQGTSEVYFASSPRFVGGMVSSQADKKFQIANNAAISGAATFNNGLVVTSLTSTAASTFNNGVIVKGTSTFTGGLTAKNGMAVGAGGDNVGERCDCSVKRDHGDADGFRNDHESDRVEYEFSLPCGVDIGQCHSGICGVEFIAGIMARHEGLFRGCVGHV